MEKRYLQYANGVYSADIDITVDEWKEMLVNRDIFYDEAIQMVQRWYMQPDYQATSKEIMLKYPSELKGTPYNGIVKGLGLRILRYLNRFEIISSDGSKSYFIIPFEGWHENYDRNKNFVWKLRDELIEAIEELHWFDDTEIVNSNDDLESDPIIETTPEGTRIKQYVTKFERSNKNRRLAIKYNKSLKCSICGFDFEAIYGERGKGFIEVHHIKPLYENHTEVDINPQTDLICVCSNCHRMFHRRKDSVPTPEQLKKELEYNKKLH